MGQTSSIIGNIPYLVFLGVMAIHAGDCGPRISAKFCSQLLSGDDSAFFRTRIVLDAAQEGEFSKSEKRPLLVWTEHLLANYQLRSIEKADSPYNPEILSNAPSTNSVMYHNVSVRKAEISKIIAEPYIKIVEQGCNGKTMVALCTEMNAKGDSDKISFRIYFQDSLERDTTKLKEYLAGLSLYHPVETAKGLSIAEALDGKANGYSTTVGELKRISWDLESRFLESWYESGPAKIKRAARFHRERHPRMEYRVGGRTLEHPPNRGMAK